MERQSPAFASSRRFDGAVVPASLAALLGVGAAGGCAVDPTSGTAMQAALDHDYFACNVERVLVKRCSMNACHGNADHALRLYSPGKLRLADEAGSPLKQRQRDAPTTFAELEANYASAVGLAFGVGSSGAQAGDRWWDQVPLLHKTIAPNALAGDANALSGGAGPGHKGGVLFRSASDPDYAAIASWLQGAKQPGGCPLLTDLMKNK